VLYISITDDTELLLSLCLLNKYLLSFIDNKVQNVFWRSVVQNLKLEFKSNTQDSILQDFLETCRATSLLADLEDDDELPEDENDDDEENEDDYMYEEGVRRISILPGSRNLIIERQSY